MSGFLNAARPFAAGLRGGMGVDQLCRRLTLLLRSFPGRLGFMAHELTRPLLDRPHGVAVRNIFPLPPVSCSLPRKGCARLAAVQRRAVIDLANLWIIGLNWLHEGEKASLSRQRPSSAQQRVLDSLLDRARSSLRRFRGCAAGGAGLHDMMKIDALAYHADGGPLRLGARAGVPDVAAVVDTAAVLEGWDSVLAQQIRDPAELLLPQDAWPPSIKAPFEHVDASYPALVQRACEVGLQSIDDVDTDFNEGPLRVRGVVRTMGGFAVPKDAREDRWIAPCEFVNAITDKRRLRKVKMPYLPMLGILTTKKGRKMWISKRDARHYFHVLKNTKAWQKYFRGPPVFRDGKRVYPRHHGWPMGYAASALIAQSVTEVCAERAGVPQSRRLLPGLPCPAEPPVWGAIIDDFWTIGGEGYTCDEEDGGQWAHGVQNQWEKVGVASHPGKARDKRFGEEVQGAFLHPRDHTFGLAPQRSLDLMCSLLLGAVSFAPGLAFMEKAVGRAGHAHCFRTCQRSVYSAVHVWLLRGRENKARRLVMNVEVCEELLVSAILLPLSYMCFQQPWCPTVWASDASPGGHGMAYTVLSPDTAQSWARVAAHKGDYDILIKESCLAIPAEKHQRLQGAILPLAQSFWHTVPRPGGYAHITLEEYDAFLWVETEKLLRGVIGHRTVHVGDNAGQVGAHAKGRSSNRRVNRRCRRGAALQLCGDNVTFEVWERSKFNPADAPSSVFGCRAEAATAAAYDRARGIARAPTCARTFRFLHIFSGPRRHGDLQYGLEHLAAAAGFAAVVVSYDPAVHANDDILNDEQFSLLRKLCWQGWFYGKHGGPVCATWSAARYMPNGPPPLRSRDKPYGLDNLSFPHQVACTKGSEFYLRDLDLSYGVVAAGGRTTTEHPADRGHRPFASIFATPQTKKFLKLTNSMVVVTHQCMDGASTRKATGIMGNVEGLSGFAKLCTHDRGAHLSKTGRDGAGNFHTKGTEHYPPEFCRRLSRLFINSFALHSDWRIDVDEPQPFLGAKGVTSCGSSRRAAVPHDVWPLRACDGLLDDVVERHHRAPLRGGTGAAAGPLGGAQGGPLRLD